MDEASGCRAESFVGKRAHLGFRAFLALRGLGLGARSLSRLWSLYLEGRGDLVSRLIIRITGVINLRTKSLCLSKYTLNPRLKT